MIQKLYKLKKMQTDQKLVQKQQKINAVHTLDQNIQELWKNINQTGINRQGAISDFTILQMHKNSMKLEIKKAQTQKKLFEKEIESINKQIVELQKQSEQFKYLLEKEKEQKHREMLKNEELQIDEFVQAKWNNKSVS